MKDNQIIHSYSRQNQTVHQTTICIEKTMVKNDPYKVTFPNTDYFPLFQRAHGLPEYIPYKDITVILRNSGFHS